GMKLYSHALAPNPRRVRIFAAEKGIELAVQDIDILAGQSRRPEFLAKEPVRRSAGAGARRRVISRRVGRDLPLSGGAPSRAKPVRARLARAGADRDVEPADGTGAVRRNRTHGSKYEPNLSRSKRSVRSSINDSNGWIAS